MHAQTKTRWLPILASLSLVILATACGDASTSKADASPEVVNLDTTAIIGASGGVIEVTHGGSELLGLRVEVPAGAFSSDTAVTISPRESSGSTNALAPGLAALGAGFDLVADAPFAEDIQIAFPIRAAVVQDDQLLSAFYFDDEASEWTAQFAQAVDAGEFSIATRRLGAWRWGLMLLVDVEQDSLTSPLESTYGADAIASIKKGAQDYIDAQLEDLNSFLTWNSCDALNAIFDSVGQTRDEAKLATEANLNATCGPCELGVEVLIEDLVAVIKGKFIKNFGEQLIDNIDFGGPGIGGFIAGIVMEGMAKAAVDAASMPQLNCDYRCYYDENPELYWETLGAYYAAEATLVALVVGSVFAECVIE